MGRRYRTLHQPLHSTGWIPYQHRLLAYGSSWRIMTRFNAAPAAGCGMAGSVCSSCSSRRGIGRGSEWEWTCVGTQRLVYEENGERFEFHSYEISGNYVVQWSEWIKCDVFQQAKKEEDWAAETVTSQPVPDSTPNNNGTVDYGSLVITVPFTSYSIPLRWTGWRWGGDGSTIGWSRGRTRDDGTTTDTTTTG